MNSSYNIHIKSLVDNLLAGVGLCLLKRSELLRFHYSLDQAILLISVNFLLVLCVEYLAVMPDPEFNSYGISSLTLKLTGLMLTGFVVVKLSGQQQMLLPFIIQVISATPTFYLINSGFSYTVEPGVYKTVFWVMNFWALAIIFSIAVRMIGNNKFKSLIATGCYGLAVIGPMNWIPTGGFWYQSSSEMDFDKLLKINQEDLFYEQFDYLTTIKQTLEPGNPRSTDLYFLGFGSYGFEDVFMKEINYIKPLMDRKFNTQGRSVALINNLKTINDTPLATASNLKRVLKTIGETMDQEDDILFLYLTSHGSRKHNISVQFIPLDLNPVTPQMLKTSLDDAGIKWRIILVSACYSGGYIEPLKDPYTLVFTASAHDRQSFGCGSASDFTYFGRAVFIDQLANESRFLPAFERAIEEITKREKKENRKLSLPQLYVGAEMSIKLEHLSQNSDSQL